MDWSLFQQIPEMVNRGQHLVLSGATEAADISASEMGWVEMGVLSKVNYFNCQWF